MDLVRKPCICETGSPHAPAGAHQGPMLCSAEPHGMINVSVMVEDREINPSLANEKEVEKKKIRIT